MAPAPACSRLRTLCSVAGGGRRRSSAGGDHEAVRGAQETFGETGVAELVGADVAGEDGETGQVALQTGSAGAAFDEDDRADAEVENVERDLEDAHVGVDAGEEDLLVAALAQVVGELVGDSGIAGFGKDEVGLGMVFELFGQVGVGFVGTLVPIEEAVVGTARFADELGEEDRSVLAAL
jgi:hypothetical protein